MVCLLMVAVPVYAKDKAVTISSASGTTTSVTVSGTTEALAVVVQVRDTENNIVLIHSMGTVDGKFTGTIDEDVALAASKEYTVYVADYEGSDWATTKITIPAAPSVEPGNTPEKTPDTTPEKPKMGDISVVGITLMMAAGAVLIIAGLYVGLIRRRFSNK